MTDIDGNADGTAATTDDANAPKALRDQNSKLNKQLETALAELAEAKKVANSVKVADALVAHGAEAKLKKYIPQDVVEPDAVLAWLQENGDDFGWENPANVDTSLQDQQQLISKATAQAPPQAARSTADATFDLWKNGTDAQLIAAGLLEKR